MKIFLLFEVILFFFDEFSLMIFRLTSDGNTGGDYFIGSEGEWDSLKVIVKTFPKEFKDIIK